MTIPESFLNLLSRLSRATYALQYSHGLNPAQWEALRYLDKANRYSASPSSMADYLGTTKGTVSQTLISLESKGLIKRERGSRDRRATVLSLTGPGNEILNLDPLSKIYDSMDRFSAKERQQLFDVMNVILDDLCLQQNSTVFGVCEDCCHLEEGSCDGATNSNICGLTGDELEASDLDLICIDFSPSHNQRVPPSK